MASSHSNGHKQISPPAIVYIGITCSIISLFFGLLIGISALAENNGFYLNGKLAEDIIFHPDLMVFGVIGGLLITEKLELMEKFKLYRNLKISRIIVVLLFPGVFIASLGILMETAIVEDVGLISITAASLFFLYYMTSERNPGLSYIKYVSGAAIFAMALSSIANLNHFITESPELTYLVLLFPIIYVLAERIELGYVRGMKTPLIRIQSILSWILVILAFLSVETGQVPFPQILMLISIAILTVMVLVSLFYDPVFRSMKKKSRLQSYMQRGIIISYVWLFLGLALFTLQIVRGHGFLDPAAHSIALGFIGTFIISHSPVIFPLTLKKKAVQENVSYLPLVVITIANVMRIFGDLTIPISNVATIFSYASGYVILIAIVAFVYNLKKIMSPESEKHTKSPKLTVP